MTKYNALAFALCCVLLVSFSLSARADYSEESMPRPYGSSEYANGYTETDKGQIKETVKTGLLKWEHYNIYLPDGETEAVSYKRPAILLLHGAGRTGASLVERWRKIADNDNVILIGPHANGRWDPASDAKYFIPALLKDTIKKYNIDPNRIYVFGHSMGGVFACFLAIMQPDSFAALGIHAGMLPENVLPMLSGEGRKTPIIMINGTRDKGFPISQVRQTAKAFAKTGHDVKLKVLENHGHWYYDIAPSVNQMAWDYFKRKSLE